MSTDSIRAERDRFVAFSFASADLLMEMDPTTGVVLFASGAAKAITRHSIQDLLGKSFLNLLLPADRTIVQQKFAQIKAGGRMLPTLVRVVHEPKVYVSVIFGGCRLPNSPNYYVTATMADRIIGEGSDNEYRDSETGLLDTASFADKAARMIDLASMEGSNSKVTLVDLGDVSVFLKSSNAEDQEHFFAQVGAFLRSSSLDGDSAARLDPGKFGVLHNDSITDSEIKGFISNLTKEIDPKKKGQKVQTVEISTDSAQLGQQDAVKALLYSVNKFAETGAENFTISNLSDSLNQLMDETLTKVSALRSAVSENDFHLVFQPIVSLKNRMPHHYEALSRFKGGRTPFQVVTFAEEVGMVEEFDMAVCHKALQQVIDLTNQGKRIPIAVNLSAQSLESTLFIASLRRMLEQHSKIRSCMMFELTESSHIGDFERVNGALQMLRHDGHQVCLDDVGAGATSFQYIRRLQVDFIKIDGSYVQSMCADSRDRSFVRAISQLSRDLSVQSIGEMVETEEQAKILVDENVGFGQGWLFGRPGALTVEEIEKAMTIPVMGGINKTPNKAFIPPTGSTSRPATL